MPQSQHVSRQPLKNKYNHTRTVLFNLDPSLLDASMGKKRFCVVPQSLLFIHVQFSQHLLAMIAAHIQTSARPARREPLHLLPKSYNTTRTRHGPSLQLLMLQKVTASTHAVVLKLKNPCVTSHFCGYKPFDSRCDQGTAFSCALHFIGWPEYS